MRKIHKKIPRIILSFLSDFHQSKNSIEKLFEMAILSEKEDERKKLTSNYVNEIFIHIKAFLSTLNKNFDEEKFLAEIKSESKKRSLDRMLSSMGK